MLLKFHGLASLSYLKDIMPQQSSWSSWSCSLSVCLLHSDCVGDVSTVVGHLMDTPLSDYCNYLVFFFLVLKFSDNFVYIQLVGKTSGPQL